MLNKFFTVDTKTNTNHYKADEYKSFYAAYNTIITLCSNYVFDIKTKIAVNQFVRQLQKGGIDRSSNY